MILSRVRLVGVAVVVLGASAVATTSACGSSGDESNFSSGGASSGASSGASGASGSGGPFGSSGASGGAPDAAAADECKKMDIVFVVDNSGSMKEEQTNLAANFPKFVKVIDDYKTKSGASLDYRIAVTSSDDKKDKGAFAMTRGPAAPNGCSAGPSRRWLERTDPDVASAFACRAQLGVNGANTERPLECALLGVYDRVLDKTNTSNGESFMRDDALLAMVVITDEDEGSEGGNGDLARPMAQYPSAFDKAKRERGRWAAAVIAGPNDCTSTFGEAAEATRLKAFVADVGKNGVFASICTGDLTDGLTKALATFDQACKDFPTGTVK